MTSIVSIEELARMTPDGAQLGVGGVHFSRLPIALVQHILSQGKKDFVFTGWGGGLALELFLEAGAVRKLIFCFSSLDIFGLAPRFRETLESRTIEVEEWTALAMVQALHAAHFNLPELPFQLPLGSDMMQSGGFWKETVSVFSGAPLGQARRLDIDVLLLHVQRADHAGNIEIQGARGLDLSLLGAARTVLVTAEEIVNTGTLGDAPRSFVLPNEFVTALAPVPWGAYPTSCLPYYATDYRELLRYSMCGQTRNRESVPREASVTNARYSVDGAASRFNVEEQQKSFLFTAAQTRTANLSSALLGKFRIPAAGSAWTIDELMTVCLAREYDNASVCSVGSVSPLAMVSYLLAKKTHAPHLTIITLNGGLIDIDFHPMSLTFAEPLEFKSAKVCWGGDETYHWYYQQGRITHEVITAAQIDSHGRTNNAWICNAKKLIRLPGQGGMADVANLHRNFTLYLTRHSPDRFVDTVEFCTAARGLLTEEVRRSAGLPQGKVRLISELGIFELDLEERIFCLVSIHPGIIIDEIGRRSGGKFHLANPLPITTPPSAEELRLIRNEIDPFGIRRLEFVPGRERFSMIESILKAESGVVRELQPHLECAASHSNTSAYGGRT